MSETQGIKDGTNREKRRRRRRDDDDAKAPIKVVSSLGEGKLMDRFQTAVSEKKERKKRHEKNEKDRQLQKEKRQKEVAKFKAEIDALLEESPPALKPSEKMATFVPKLRGTVKGKFEELEKKKHEEEKKKAENERKKRTDKDLKDKKMIEIEIAKKKLQNKQNNSLISDDENSENILKQKKSPGKLNAFNFEEMARQREEKEMRKANLERKMKMEAERRAFKEMNSKNNESDSNDDASVIKPPMNPAPRRLSTRFDEIARAHEEEQRKKAENESRKRLEEEKRNFRQQKLVADDDSSSNEEPSARDRVLPKKLSSSLTKFDEVAKEKMEEEKCRLKERRKQLLEKEMKLFEESKKSLEQQDSSSTDESEEDKSTHKANRPRRLDSSFTKFDLVTRQKLQEKRESIQKERARLLEEEKKMFTEEKKIMGGQSESESTSESNSNDSVNEVENRKKKLTKRRKKTKSETDDGPSKLDTSKLNFDVIERQRIEKERWKIQEQRRRLLDDEKRIFEEARKQRLENQQPKRDDSKVKSTESPSKLEYSKTRFDIMAQHKMEEEKQRIREERSRLLREEKKIFEEERKRIEMEQSESESSKTEDISSKKITRKPSRLDKSFTEFDILAKKKKEEEREKIMRESQKKLEEEKKVFREAKKMMEAESSSEDDGDSDDSPSSVSPGKLSRDRTDFQEMEKKRVMAECEHIYNEKLRQLEEEKRLFAEARKTHCDDFGSDDDDTKCEVYPNRLPSVLTNFEQTEQNRLERERMEAHERKIKEIEDELNRFKEERQLMNDSDKEERGEISKPQVTQPRPKKLSVAFTKFDELARLNQEKENQRRKEEKARELEEERIRFQASKQNEVDSDSDDDEQCKRIHRPINKLNVRDQMEAVLQAQREAERQRIMETKFCRMTVEQQEMFLAKEAQLNMLREKLARAEAGEDDESYPSDEDSDEYECEEYEKSEHVDESQDSSEEQHQEAEESDTDSQTSSQITDGTGSSGSSDSGYNGAPWFTETLSNITLREGKPVRFDAVILADPHPKVTWYFKNRLIRNSPDYQYINKGTQYSLYMNESFFDDSGEYVCKAENPKGVATSKAILTIIDG